jgi:hypothetical protein
MTRLPFVCLGGLLLAIVVFGACSSDSDADDNTNHGVTTNVEILAVLTTLTDANLHHVEGTLTGAEPAIDPAWLAPIERARTAVALITWPADLSHPAQAFLDDSATLLDALSDDDVEAAAEVVPQAHASWHLLRDPGYAYLAAQAGVAMGASADHDHEDGTPEEESHDE